MDFKADTNPQLKVGSAIAPLKASEAKTKQKNISNKYFNTLAKEPIYIVQRFHGQ